MKVLIGSPICQEPEILKEFLGSIRSLWMEDFVADALFVDDNEIFESKAMLKDFSLPQGRVTVLPGSSICGSSEANGTGYYLCDEYTHHWREELIKKVARYKDAILSAAIEGDYDFVFLVDSDLVLNPVTLAHLVSTGKDIISEIYWTKWTPEQETELPQVWLGNQYDLFRKEPGESLPPEEIARRAAEFIAQLRQPGIYPVGGLGGCTLISRPALLKGVSFREIPNLDLWGEDRHFCVRAAALGIELWVDTHFPCYHLYRRSDFAGLPAYKAKAEKLKEEYLESRASRPGPLAPAGSPVSSGTAALLTLPRTSTREVNIHQTEIWERNWSRLSDPAALATWSVMDQEIYQIVRNEVGPPGQRILEAGSGSGKISLMLAQDGHRITLIDYSQAALSASRALYASAGVKAAEFVYGSILNMPFPDGSFDVVWNAGVLEHFSPKEQRRALAEMRRVCRPGGRIITLNPNARCLLYRFGKWLAEKRNAWPFGYEEPVVSLAEQFAAVGIRMEREYDAAFRSGVTFLSYYPQADLLIRAFDLWFR